jgi:hypothetical protein
MTKKKAIEPRILVMGDDRDDKNRSTTGTSRRFEMGGSKLATRNKSVKNKLIPQRDFSQNDVVS